jgi:hypothetical protein
MRWLRYVTGGVLAVLGLATAFLYYDNYWRWRDCFNEEGRCFDPVSANVYLEQAGLVWGGFTLIFVLIASILVFWPRRS